jgi:phosphoserine phosphatase
MKNESTKLLVVDLDGTLLRGDMLFESFWSAVEKNWRIPFISLYFLTRGRALLKRH